MALAGSTNAVLHLLALAGRVGVDLGLDRFDEISRRTPVLANVRPSGAHLVEDLFHAGGVPVVLRELLPLLDGDALSVSGRSLAENVAGAPIRPTGRSSPRSSSRSRPRAGSRCCAAHWLPTAR